MQRAMEKVIMGIDPGTNLMGYGVLRVSGRQAQMLALGVIDLRRYAVCTVAPQTTTITHNYYYYESRSSTTKTAHHIFTLTPDDWGWTLPIPQPVLNQNTGMENNPRGTRTYTVGDL